MSTGVQKHPFHLVDPSPWPLFTSVGAFMTTFGGVIYFHGFLGGELLLSFGFLMILYAMFVWWRDVIREATFQGHHTWAVQDGLRIGMILFIVSEVMFFMAFFWAFFHSSLAPTVDIGAVWPPKGIEVLNPWEVPFFKHCSFINFWSFSYLCSPCDCSWITKSSFTGFSSYPNFGHFLYRLSSFRISGSPL